MDIAVIFFFLLRITVVYHYRKFCTSLGALALCERPIFTSTPGLNSNSPRRESNPGPPNRSRLQYRLGRRVVIKSSYLACRLGLKLSSSVVDQFNKENGLPLHNLNVCKQTSIGRKIPSISIRAVVFPATASEQVNIFLNDPLDKSPVKIATTSSILNTSTRHSANSRISSEIEVPLNEI